MNVATPAGKPDRPQSVGGHLAVVARGDLLQVSRHRRGLHQLGLPLDELGERPTINAVVHPSSFD